MAVQCSSRFNRSPLAMALATALLLPPAAMAQDAGQAGNTPSTPAQDAEDTSQTRTLDKVTVVGSRIKRVNLEGPSPVTIITAEEIEKEGFNTIHDALETISQNTGSAQNDFNSNGGFTPNASVINLRGMGPGRTLLLINGRRVNDYPFPYNGRSNFQNFNAIPAGAVQRIEVLAGGASAIYGSDAVAGVVNVVLKTNYSGDEVKLKYQTATRGGRDISNLQWTGGKTSDNWSLTYAFEYLNSEPLFGWERDFMDSGADNPAPPGVNGSAGVGGYQPSIGIQLRRISATGSTQAYIMPTGRGCSADPLYRDWTYTSSTSGATLGPGCGYDRFVAEQTVANGNRDISAYLYGTYDFDNGVQAWASLSAYKSRGRLGGGVEQWFGGPQPNGQFYDPDLGVRVFPIRALTPATYGGSEGTFQKFDERSYDFAVGLRGTIADRWDWDFTLGGAKYHAIRDRPRLTVAGATSYFMGERLGTTTATTAPGIVNAGLPIYRLNLDRFFGPISAEDYASMSTLVHYDGKSDNASAQFTLSGDLFELPAGAVAFAGVLEASRQSYDLQSDRRIFPDVREIYNLTGTGGGGERNRYALGAEFKIPLFSQLTMNLAGRFDKYDDITQVDDAKTWGAGLEYRPFSNLLIRGSFATSFKAPDMHYVFSERSGSFGTVTDYTRCLNAGIAGTACSAAGATYNYQVFTTSEGQPGLSEETGKSWSAGFVWDATDNLSLSMDYYRIDLENVVTVQSGTSILQSEYACQVGNYPTSSEPFPYTPGSEYCNNIASRIDRNAETGALTEIRSGPINLAFQGTKGIDGSIRYGWDAGNWGKFTAQATWSQVLEQTDRATPTAPLRSYRDFNSNADFRSRARMSLSWTREAWDATAVMLRTGSFPIWQPAAAEILGIGARTGPNIVWNTSVGYKVNDSLSMRLSVENLFDKLHPQDPTFNSYPYFWRAYSPIGRSIGLEARYKFNQ